MSPGQGCQRRALSRRGATISAVIYRRYRSGADKKWSFLRWKFGSGEDARPLGSHYSPTLRERDFHRDAFVATHEKSRAPEHRLTLASRYRFSEHRALELCWNLRSIDCAIEDTLHTSIRRAEGHLKTETERLHKSRRVV